MKQQRVPDPALASDNKNHILWRLEHNQLIKRKEAARRLISFINDEFGEHLAALLLGDYCSSQRRLSQISLVTVSTGTQELMLNVEIKTGDKWGLTCGQEPLVMIVLLKLLFARRQLLTGTASYTYEEVLHLLGWKDSKQSRDDIGDAIDINFIQSFNLSAHTAETPMSFQKRQHMVAGYEFIEAADNTESGCETSLYRGDFLIDFNFDFIRCLRERSLLGIDWNLVTSIVRCHEGEGLSEESD